MSVRQYEFQLQVIRKRLHMSALDIEQVFREILTEAMGLAEPSETAIRETVKKIRTQTKYAMEFATLMEAQQGQLKQLMGQGITVATRLFHHAELSHGATMGRVTQDGALWQKVYQGMIRTVFTYPQMYMSEGSLDRSLSLIENMLDLILYHEIPLVFVATPLADVVPLTPANLHHTQRESSTRVNQRVAPSVISMASSVPATHTPHEDPDEDPPESVIPDDDAHTIMARRQQHTPVGSTITSNTQTPGVLQVRIPAEMMKRTRNK